MRKTAISATAFPLGDCPGDGQAPAAGTLRKASLFIRYHVKRVHIRSEEKDMNPEQGADNVATQSKATAGQRRANNLPEVPFNDIDAPGSYLVVDTGTLFRIPAEGLAAGHSPLISITAREQVRVAKLSWDPATPITKLRTIAADNDLMVDF